MDQQPLAKSTDVIVFGLGRFGMLIAQTLQKRGMNVLAVDFNPELVEDSVMHGVPTRYGDAEDPEFIASLPLMEATWIIGTLRDRHVSLVLLKSLKEAHYPGKIALAGHNQSDSDRFQSLGADLILIPYHDAALQAVERILNTSSIRTN